MDNPKMLNETGIKVFEELKKRSEQVSENMNTQTYLLDSKLTDEDFQELQPDGTLQKNFKKELGKFRSEKITLDMEIIEHKKDN